MPRRVSANEFHVVNGEDYTYVKGWMCHDWHLWIELSSGLALG